MMMTTFLLLEIPQALVRRQRQKRTEKPMRLSGKLLKQMVSQSQSPFPVLLLNLIQLKRPKSPRRQRKAGA
jgi:hypothetical protein